MPAVVVLVATMALLAACAAPPQSDPDRMTAPMTAEQVAREIDAAKAVTPLPPGATWAPIPLDPDGSYGTLSGLSSEAEAFAAANCSG